MKYIDADRLRKELNKWRDVQPSTSGLPRKATYEAIGVIQTIDHVLYLLDSLQQEQPGVDLEQTIHEKVVELHTAPSYDELRDFALYFYKLDRKTKEDTKWKK